MKYSIQFYLLGSYLEPAKYDDDQIAFGAYHSFCRIVNSRNGIQAWLYDNVTKELISTYSNLQ